MLYFRKLFIVGFLLNLLKKEERDKLCTQVIVKEELDLPEEVAKRIKKVEVFTERKLWHVIER